MHGSYIDVHDNENVYLSVDKAEVRMGQQKPADKGDDHVVPEGLRSEAAEALLKKLVDAGMLTEDWQSRVLSNAERGLVARELSCRLNIVEVWKAFGQLWGMNPEVLRSSFNKALEQRKSLGFQERLKKILS